MLLSVFAPPREDTFLDAKASFGVDIIVSMFSVTIQLGYKQTMPKTIEQKKTLGNIGSVEVVGAVNANEWGKQAR